MLSSFRQWGPVVVNAHFASAQLADKDGRVTEMEKKLKESDDKAKRLEKTIKEAKDKTSNLEREVRSTSRPPSPPVFCFVARHAPPRSSSWPSSPSSFSSSSSSSSSSSFCSCRAFVLSLNAVEMEEERSRMRQSEASHKDISLQWLKERDELKKLAADERTRANDFDSTLTARDKRIKELVNNQGFSSVCVLGATRWLHLVRLLLFALA